MPLVSYIRNSLRFWYYAALSTCYQIFKNNWGHRENLGEGGGQTFKGSDREQHNFSTWAASNIRLLIFFGEENQQAKLAQLVRKKIHDHQGKAREMTIF